MNHVDESGVTLSLAGKVALITGGSRGIGAATVRLFRKAGAKVAFSYRSAERQAEELAATCGGPDACRAIRQPLATPEDGHSLVLQAVDAFDRIDCAVLNHGVWPPHDAPISSMTTEQWRSTMGINLDSVFGVIRATVEQMRSQPQNEPIRGHIVIISSTAGQRGEAFHVDYAATKGALISLTKSLSSELIRDGIHCNCVAPGWVTTEATAEVLSDPVVSSQLIGLIPKGRPAHVDEIAAPILFLCTHHAGFISGEVLNVNGGAVLIG